MISLAVHSESWKSRSDAYVGERSKSLGADAEDFCSIGHGFPQSDTLLVAKRRLANRAQSEQLGECREPVDALSGNRYPSSWSDPRPDSYFRSTFLIARIFFAERDYSSTPKILSGIQVALGSRISDWLSRGGRNANPYIRIGRVERYRGPSQRNPFSPCKSGLLRFGA